MTPSEQNFRELLERNKEKVTHVSSDYCYVFSLPKNAVPPEIVRRIRKVYLSDLKLYGTEKRNIRVESFELQYLPEGIKGTAYPRHKTVPRFSEDSLLNLIQFQPPESYGGSTMPLEPHEVVVLLNALGKPHGFHAIQYEDNIHVLKEGQQIDTLLRAASAPKEEKARTLLRPAGATETPEERLLRPLSGENRPIAQPKPLIRPRIIKRLRQGIKRLFKRHE